MTSGHYNSIPRADPTKLELRTSRMTAKVMQYVFLDPPTRKINVPLGIQQHFPQHFHPEHENPQTIRQQYRDRREENIQDARKQKELKN